MKRSVIVTAGGGGIGLAIAQRFAAEGDSVHVCDVDDEALEQAGGQRGITAHPADVGNPGDMERLVADVLARDGRIDVLVNNAGLGGPRKPVEAFSVEEWQRVFDVNIHGAFYLVRAIVPGMKDRRSGAIVNISTTSVKIGVPQRSVYVVTKGALMAFTTALARELGPFGITCNAVLPGFVKNARGKMLLEAAAARNGLTPEEQWRRRLSFISMRRPVGEGDIAEMVEFLASSRASVVSGQFISVDGHNEWEGDPIY